MAYYLEYNNVDLTNIVGVRSVEMPGIPSITHSKIDVFERDGNVYNGLSYGTREIKISFIVKSKNIDEYELNLRDAIRAFYTKEEARLFCGSEDYYIWCVPSGDVKVTEVVRGWSECEITLLAYNPYWYSTESTITSSGSDSVFIVNNESDLPVFPTLNLSVDSDAHFVQIDNQTTGESILVGKYPSLENPTITTKTDALVDECESLSGWTSSATSLDEGRSGGGTMSIADGGSGIVCSDFGASGSSVWHGASYRKSLSNSCTDFRATIDFTFTSTGTNGDPSKPYENDDESTTISGTKGTYYEVVAKSTNVRDKASVKNGKKIGTLKKGYKVTTFTKVNSSWLKFTYNGQTAYVSTKYLKKMTGDGTITTKERNYVVVKSVNLRTQPTTLASSSVILTLKPGTVIRCYTEKFGTGQGYLKLAKKYNGKIGYVFESGYLVQANNYSANYDYEIETADDKTGVIEVYGYAADNTQIFKLGMYDDNEWYEHNVPIVTYSGKTLITDKTNAKAPKTETDYTDKGQSSNRYLSGTYGSWNDIEHCEIYIERVSNKVWASIKKIEDGVITKSITSGSSYLDTSDVSDKELSYIVLYIGTSGDDISKASDMMLNYILITSEDGVMMQSTNVPQIPRNSDMVISNGEPSVYIDNVESNNLVDIGSSFFTLVTGENRLKITSTANVYCDVIYNKRCLNKPYQ